MQNSQILYPFQIDLVKELYGSDMSSEQLLEYINIEFDCNYTLNDLYLCIEEQEKEDLEIQFKNLGLI